MDAVVQAVRPGDGTQDGEASRDAVDRALSEVLKRFPNASLLEPTDVQRALAIEAYLAFDVFNRFQLDVGAALQKAAETVTAWAARIRDVKDYIRQKVAAAFRERYPAGGPRPTARVLATIADAALRSAFTVFEDYLQ